MYLIEPKRDGKEITDMATLLAMQVYGLDHLDLDDDLIFPYRPSQSIQVGKYQNTREEINAPFVKEHHIPVVRRETGGGTIYMDRNHANFCFVMQAGGPFNEHFKRIYEPAIAALSQLGAKNVALSGRNDLEIDGQKVSGAAITLRNHRLYAGYSLLLDIDYDTMTQALKPNKKKIESKGIKSIRRRVTGIRPHLAPQYQNITADEFSDLILKQLLGVDDLADAKRYELTDRDWKAIDQLVQERFGNWDWNYGHSPDYSYQRDGRFPAGTIQIQLNVQKGIITACKIYGDFFGEGDVSDVEDALLNTAMREDALQDSLSSLDLDYYFGKLEPQDLISLILD